MKENNEYLLDLFASQCMNGLISRGELPSWSVAHQAYSMAQIMVECREQYVEKENGTV